MLPDREHYELHKTILNPLELILLPFLLPHVLVGMFSLNQEPYNYADSSKMLSFLITFHY